MYRCRTCTSKKLKTVQQSLECETKPCQKPRWGLTHARYVTVMTDPPVLHSMRKTGLSHPLLES
eukprot:104548-Amphidinium_carterae.1